MDYLQSIVYYSSYFLLVTDNDLNMGDMSGGNFYLNNHTLSQQYCDFNNGDVCSEYGIVNSHTFSQCQDSILFKNIEDDVKNVDGGVSSGYGC